SGTGSAAPAIGGATCYLTIARKDQSSPPIGCPETRNSRSARARRRAGLPGRLPGCLFGFGGGRGGRLFRRPHLRDQVGGAGRGVLALLRLAFLAHVHVLAHAPFPGDPGVRSHDAGFPITAGSPTPRLLSRPGCAAPS